MHALPGCTFFVDCQPCVDAVHAGPAACSADNKPLARVHAFMHLALDDVPKESVIWMSAHLRPGACGTAVRGDGPLVQEIDVGANAEADRYAKLALLEHRVPAAIRKQLKEHDELVTANAKCIARASAIANDQPGKPNRDTEAFRAKAAQTASARLKLKLAQRHGDANQRGEATARRVDHGGHVLERHGAGWWCTTCRARSIKWQKLAPQVCGGPAAKKWAKKARDSKAKARSGCRTTHHVMRSGTVMWCAVCGGRMPTPRRS